MSFRAHLIAILCLALAVPSLRSSAQEPAHSDPSAARLEEEDPLTLAELLMPALRHLNEELETLPKEESPAIKDRKTTIQKKIESLQLTIESLREDRKAKKKDHVGYTVLLSSLQLGKGPLTPVELIDSLKASRAQLVKEAAAGDTSATLKSQHTAVDSLLSSPVTTALVTQDQSEQAERNRPKPVDKRTPEETSYLVTWEHEGFDIKNPDPDKKPSLKKLELNHSSAEILPPGRVVIRFDKTINNWQYFGVDLDGKLMLPSIQQGELVRGEMLGITGYRKSSYYQLASEYVVENGANVVRPFFKTYTAQPDLRGRFPQLSAALENYKNGPIAPIEHPSEGEAINLSVILPRLQLKSEDLIYTEINPAENGFQLISEKTGRVYLQKNGKRESFPLVDPGKYLRGKVVGKHLVVDEKILEQGFDKKNRSEIDSKAWVYEDGLGLPHLLLEPKIQKAAPGGAARPTSFITWKTTEEVAPREVAMLPSLPPEGKPPVKQEPVEEKVEAKKKEAEEKIPAVVAGVNDEEVDALLASPAGTFDPKRTKPAMKPEHAEMKAEAEPVPEPAPELAPMPAPKPKTDLPTPEPKTLPVPKTETPKPEPAVPEVQYIRDYYQTTYLYNFQRVQGYLSLHIAGSTPVPLKGNQEVAPANRIVTRYWHGYFGNQFLPAGLYYFQTDANGHLAQVVTYHQPIDGSYLGVGPGKYYFWQGTFLGPYQ